MSTEAPALPVLTVLASNWTCDVEINEMNAEFPFEIQAYEAAAQAIEAASGVKENPTFRMLDKDNNVMTGHVLQVYPKDQDPEKLHVFIESFWAFADAGLYKKAIPSRDAYFQRLAEIEEEKRKKS